MSTDSERADELYSSPFLTRWAGDEMLRNWSDARRFRLWRSLWIALAEAQVELGLDFPAEALKQLLAHRDDLNLEAAHAYEEELRHDVMAHVRAYGDQCPDARGIIHLGATSCFVTDNSELIMMRDGLRLLLGPLAAACRQLVAFARAHRDVPCLGYTHLQPAQLTTVGKRACLWLHDLMDDLAALAALADEVPLRGVKGTTGTQASFMALFDGDEEKVKELERRVAQKMGFERVFPVTGQTYPRKFDYRVLATLAGLGISTHKMAADIRLLSSFKEIEEPFGSRQVGSSAMAYKRNPMRCERMASLARFLINNVQNAAFTAADQWLERTLDDSANRRLSLAEGFLAADAIARLAQNITGGLVVNRKVIEARVRAELPFMATEEILMEAVKAGGDRQELHERIRRHSMAAAQRVKSEGADNDLLERIRADEAFAAVRARLDRIVAPDAFVGRAPQQVEEYLSLLVEPVLRRFGRSDEGSGRLRV
jgi:adenylosuccinate lyase